MVSHLGKVQQGTSGPLHEYQIDSLGFPKWSHTLANDWPGCLLYAFQPLPLNLPMLQLPPQARVVSNGGRDLALWPVTWAPGTMALGALNWTWCTAQLLE